MPRTVARKLLGRLNESAVAGESLVIGDPPEGISDERSGFIFRLTDPIRFSEEQRVGNGTPILLPAAARWERIMIEL